MPKFMKSLNNISRCQAIFRSSKLHIDDIYACHHPFILAVCGDPGCSQEDIARKLCLNKSTVARAMTYLEEHEYVTRIPCPEDKRQFSVFPTDKMLDVADSVRRVASEWNLLISRKISEEEMSVFYSVLSRMEDSAKKIIDSCEDTGK